MTALFTIYVARSGIADACRRTCSHCHLPFWQDSGRQELLCVGGGGGGGGGTPVSPAGSPGASSAAPVEGLGELRLRQMACGEQAAIVLTQSGAVYTVQYSARDRQVRERRGGGGRSKRRYDLKEREKTSKILEIEELRPEIES